MRYLTKRTNQIPIFKVKDILNKDNLNFLVNDLLLKYSLIEKTTPMNLSKLGIEDIKIFAAMENKKIREYIMKHHKKSYRRYKKRSNNLLKRVKDENYHLVIGERIKDKCEELLCS